MKTTMLATCSLALLVLAGCATDQPRTSLRPGGTYDPQARVRAAEAESSSGRVIVMPYGGAMWGPYGYGYQGPYYGGSFGYGYAPWYGYGGYPGPIYVPPRHHRPHVPPPSSSTPRTPNNPPRNFRDLFPGAKR